MVVPLISWEPLHPPEAVQDSAPVVLHCKVVVLPLGTLLLFAIRVTAGFAVLLVVAVVEVLSAAGLEVCVSADDDSPQAASAANTAHPSAQPTTRRTWTEYDDRRDILDPRRGLWSTKLMRLLRRNLPGHPLQRF
ncbi:MAG TPA: hypothetical protein VN327_16095, partial [Pseudonocardiaceae bacterium]|nr:hypothetical protein [Pseudonocardiaceae bacterium]